MVRPGRLKVMLSTIAALVAAAVAVASPSAVALPPRPAAATPVSATSATEAADQRTAIAEAKRSRKRVEVTSERTETSTLYANPDGTFTLESSLRPIRTKHGNHWEPVDATLRRNADGSYSPRSALAPMTFSGGGDKAFASIRTGAKRLTLGWPGRLPAPTVRGTTVTYADVLPGVDLAVQAEVDGFTHVLVVKNREAAANPALERFTYPLSAPGLSTKVHAKSPSVVTAADASGTVVLRGTAMMWDSRTRVAKQAPSNPGRPAETARELEEVEPRHAPVRLEAKSGSLTVKPDLALLRGADTQYPVMIDPVWQIAPAGLNHWSTVATNASNPLYNRGLGSSSNSYAGEVKVGKSPADGGFVARAFFEFNTSGIRYKNIHSSTFSIKQLWSSSWCGDKTVRTTQLWGTYATDTTTVWNTPWNRDNYGWMDAQGTSNSLKFYNSSSCPAGNVDFDATGFVQRSAREGWTSTTLGLRARNENDSGSWKRYEKGTAQLSITYNSYPNSPDQMSVDGQTCNSGTKLWVRSRTPQLRARVTDPDTGQPLAGRLYWAASGAGIDDSRMVQRTNLGNPGFAQAPTPQYLVDGNYYFQAYANDEINDSQVSAQCSFTVDATAPPKPTGVSSSLYPDANIHGSVGQPDLFTLRPPTVRNDFDHYCYTVADTADSTSCTHVAAGADGVATALIYPAKPGVNALRVWSVDKAGNLSRGTGGSDPDFLLYEFGVGPGSAPAAHFKVDEGTGTSATDVSAVHPDTAALTGGATWTTGRGGRGSALSLNGTTAFAATAGPLVGRNATDTANAAVRTDQSFTVSAWAKLTTASTFRTVLSQEGTHTGAFNLEYAPSCDCWRFTVHHADALNPAYTSAAASSAAPLNVWTHLVGVYDATGNSAKLYVNGALAQSVTVPVPLWNATGAVAIGRTRYNDGNAHFWAGQIDDVRVWNRVLVAGEAKALYHPAAPVVTTASPDVTVGTPFTVTLSSGGDTNVKKFKYWTSIANVQSVNANADGSPVTVQVTLTETDVLYVGAFAYYDDGTPVGAQSDAGRWDLRVHRPTSVSGTVVDGDRLLPVAGATVKLQPGGTTVTTDGSGRYSIGGLQPGLFQIAVASGANRCGLFASTELDLPEGPTTVDLALAPQGDAHGYTCSVGSKPFVAGTTPVPLVDNEVARVQLPFTTTFYGTEATSVWIGRHGVLSFKEMHYYTGWTPTSIPTGGAPNSAVAPLWLEIDQDELSSIRTAVTGTAPSRTFVIEWHDVYRTGDAAKTRFSFAAQLGEDGAIVFNYQGVPTAAAAEAVVGIESPGGRFGLQYQAFQPLVANGQAITIHPPLDPQPLGSWTLSGTVAKRDGSPAAWDIVDISPIGAQVFTDANGHYELTGLETGSYQAYTHGPDHHCDDVAVGDVHVDTDSVLDVQYRRQVDYAGYSCTAADNMPFVPADTTVLPISGDDAYAAVTLPFAFPFYGSNYTSAWVDTNGVMYFSDPGRSHYANTRLPDATAPNNLIAVMWDDLMVDASASVRTAVVGSAPNRQFVIEWRNVQFLGRSDRMSFEVLLGESGSITTKYTGEADGWYATIGIESSDAASAFQYTFEECCVWPGDQIVFHPPGDEDFTLSGVVRRSDGTPGANYIVELGEWGDQVTTTDANGRYEFTGLRRGSHRIKAMAERRCGEVIDTAVHLEADRTFNLTTSRKTDSYGYSCTVRPGTPFVPASTPVAATPQTAGTVTLPFAFTFYGRTYSTAWVDMYGTLYFTQPADGDFYQCLTIPVGDGNRIAPFGAPLYDDPATTVRTSVLGSAPNRRLVVEWHNARYWGDGAPYFHFEVILGEDGSITFNYDGIEAAIDYNEYADGVSGVEDFGNNGLSLNDHEDVMRTNEAIIIRRTT